jgi:putative SOS response-associated peptidase YedK
MFNARAETIYPARRSATHSSASAVSCRSVVHEWKREGTVRQPYRVVRRDGAPLALAG